MFNFVGRDELWTGIIFDIFKQKSNFIIIITGVIDQIWTLLTSLTCLLSLATWFITFSFFDSNISFDLEDHFNQEMIKRHEIWWTTMLNQAIEECLWASNFVTKCSQHIKDRSLNLLQKEVNKPRTNSTKSKSLWKVS